MKKAKTLLAVIAMVMSCFILLGPAEAQAAKKKDYVINITKTTPKAAEKKLRKIKGSDKRQLIFRVKARNPKDAYKKTKAWLTKFQKLSANVYGVLPSMLDKDDVELFDEDEDVKGYYTYVGDLVSDYSNMNTICKRAVTDGARQYAPGRYLLSDYESKCMLSYGNLTHPQIRETVDMEDALFDSQAVERIRKNGCTGTKNAKTVKKQSDSFRVQFFVNNLSGITLDSTLHFLKQGTLYAVAKKKCNLPAHQVANVVEDIINHLTMDCEMPEVLTGNLTRRIWRARRSDGQWDYLGFEGNKYKIEVTIQNHPHSKMKSE